MAVKREQKGPICIILLFSLVFILSILALYFVSAQDEYVPDVLGIKLTPENLDKLPKTPEDIGNVSRNYLEKQWENIINKTFVGDIHRSFLAHPTPFIVLFAEKYSFTLFFLTIFILWCFIFTIFSDIYGFLGANKHSLHLLFGLLTAILIAQGGILRFVANSALALIFRQDLWWAQLLLGMLIFGVLIILKVYSESIYELILKIREKTAISVAEKRSEKAIKLEGKIKKLENKLEAAKNSSGENVRALEKELEELRESSEEGEEFFKEISKE